MFNQRHWPLVRGQGSGVRGQRSEVRGQTDSRLSPHTEQVILPVTPSSTPVCYCRENTRPHVVHAGQGLKVGLHTPTILGGNSHLSWFYDRAIKDPAHTGTSKGVAQAITRGPIRKFLPSYANVYVSIQSHALSAGVRTHYVTGVRNGL